MMLVKVIEADNQPNQKVFEPISQVFSLGLSISTRKNLFWLFMFEKFNSTLLFSHLTTFLEQTLAFLLQRQKKRNSSTILTKKRMQASTDSLDTMVNVDTAAPFDTQDSISQPSTNNPAPDESINSLTIPYTLDIRQEDNLSIDMLKLYQVGC